MGLLLGSLLAGALTAPVLYGPSADFEPPAQERLRVRVAAFTEYGSLGGRVEKENSGAGIGSGGDKVSLRGDMDLPSYSWIQNVEAALEPAPHFRIRFAAQFMRTSGRNTLGSSFRHDGRVFATGARIESDLSGIVLDGEFHFLPRQSQRVRSEFGLFSGVRFAVFDHEVEEPGVQRVRQRTTGLWPRFGVQGYGELGSGMMVWGESAVGAWFNGDSHSSFAAASFDFTVGLGWVMDRTVDVRVGVHYATFGIWRERSDDMEQITMERTSFIFGAAFRTP